MALPWVLSIQAFNLEAFPTHLAFEEFHYHGRIAPLGDDRKGRDGSPDSVMPSASKTRCRRCENVPHLAGTVHLHYTSDHDSTALGGPAGQP